MNNEKLPIALTIAGSDSGGGAGIQADLKTFTAHKVYGASVITAITAQNTRQVTAIFDVPTDIIDAQLKAVLSDIKVDAVKIGMLSSVEIIKVVVDNLRAFGVKNIILDPVMVAKSGDTLLKQPAVSALIKYLLPISTLLTPNLPELAAILGKEIKEDRAELVNAGQEIMEMGAKNILIKGGHSSRDILTDILICGSGDVHYFENERIHTNNTHGTGCTLSSAIAADLAKGMSISAAVEDAVNWLQGAIRANVKIGEGNSPVNHLYKDF